MRKVIIGGAPKLRMVRLEAKVISAGVLKLERVQIICPACGQPVEAVARDGQTKGYCTVARQYVDFPIKRQLETKKWWQGPEYRAKLSSAMKKRWQKFTEAAKKYMLDDYYKLRGWNSDGIPTREKLLELGIERKRDTLSLQRLGRAKKPRTG